MKHILSLIAVLLIMPIMAKSQKAIDFQSLKKKYSWTVPEESFKTDSILIKGKIENYDAKSAGFTTLQCYFFNEFESQTAASMPINQDGTFEKKIRISYPVCSTFYTYINQQWFDIPFFAYPGDTVEVAAKIDDGKLVYSYPKGRSKEFEKVLKHVREWYVFSAYKFLDYKDGFDNFIVAAEDFWHELYDKIYHDGSSESFSDKEMGLALSLAQGFYVYSVLEPLLHLREECYEKKIEGQFMHLTLKNPALLERMSDPENYKFLSHVDFSDRNLCCVNGLHIILNRIPFSLMPYSENKQVNNVYPPQGLDNNKKFFHQADKLLQEALHTKGNSLIAQMVMYQDIQTFTSTTWTQMEPDSLKEIRDDILPLFSFKPIRDKAEQLINNFLDDTERTVPLKKCAATAFIDSLRNVYKGKYLYLDFWAMSCAPCRMTIETSKDLRKEIGNNPDIKLVFVNGDNPEYGAMREYVNKHLADEINIIPGEKNFNTLRDIFNFAGIPHFEVITPDGKVVKERYITFGLRYSIDYKNFKLEFDKLKEKIEK